jgi:hypothetical protein
VRPGACLRNARPDLVNRPGVDRQLLIDPGQDPQGDGFGPQDDQPYLSRPSDSTMADSFLAELHAEHDEGVRQGVETNLAVAGALAAVAGLFGRRSRRNTP